MTLSTQPLFIAATGCCTPVGTRAWQTAAHWKAKLSAYTRQAISGQVDHKATVSRVSAIEPTCTGVERLIRLAAPALHEALQDRLPLKRPLALFIALPAPWEGLADYLDISRFMVELPRALDIAPEYLPITVCRGGAAAGGDALAHAYQYMQTYPQEAEVLVGGVDSLIEQTLLDHLYARQWLNVRGHSYGFIASEGAAFIRLCREPQAEHHVVVHPPGFGGEAASRVGSGDWLSGQGLISASSQALNNAQLAAPSLHSYWSDMDGSAWRGNELASLGADIGEFERQFTPADHLGELGAAWAPVLMSLFHEMRQDLHHPSMPASALGHRALQTVSSLDTRIAAWVTTWGLSRKHRA